MPSLAVILPEMTTAAKFTVRIRTEAQLKRLRRAANARKWSLNQLFLEAAEQFAAASVEASKTREPLTKESESLPLNQ